MKITARSRRRVLTTKDLLGKPPLRVRHIDGPEFMVSVMEGLGGAIGLACFAIGATPTRVGAHRLLTAHEREEYLSKLTPF